MPRNSDAPRTTTYSDEEVGIDALVDSYLAGRHPLVRHRTVEESDAEMVAELENFRLLPIDKRERINFEMYVRAVLLDAKLGRPDEIEQTETLLFDAFYDSLDLCAERSEYLGIKLYLGEDGDYYPVWPEEEAQRHGISVDEFLDLRHECHKFAASYPVLDREHRDELLRTRREYYLEVLRLWMRDHPELVVPLDYENSVNQPYQDFLRQVCMAAEDPQECARSEGVSLP